MSVPPVHHYIADEVIFREGETGNLMYVLIEGEVEILKSVGSGHKTLSVLGKGEFFGEMALLDDSPRSATAICKKEAKLLTMSDDQLDAYIASNPDFAVKMIRNLARRLRGANKLIEQALSGNSIRTVFDGLADYVRERGVDTGKGWRFGVAAFSSWAGQHLGIPEQNIPTLLKTLSERGFLNAVAGNSAELIYPKAVVGEGV